MPPVLNAVAAVAVYLCCTSATAALLTAVLSHGFPLYLSLGEISFVAIRYVDLALYVIKYF